MNEKVPGILGFFERLMRKGKAKKKNLDTLYNTNPHPLFPFGILDTTWEHFVLTNDNGSLTLEENRLKVPFIRFLNQKAGGFQGKNILELGPYEAYHTCALNKMGAAQIVAIEGNPRNFLKCLIVKNYHQLDKTQFLLGDCTKFLNQTDERYDFILAAGVLYHSAHPMNLLEQITERSNAIGICTTLYDPNNLVFYMTGKTREVVYDGAEPFVLYQRTNPTQTLDAKFGMDSSAWLITKEDLLRFLEFRNFRYEIFETESTHSEKAPRIQLYAVKRDSSTPLDKD